MILFNTCSVRQHAEDKIYSALGRLRPHKRRHPETVIGVLGCMAQKDQELILRRAPHVDIVCGTGQLARLPELIAEVESHRPTPDRPEPGPQGGFPARGRAQLRELRSAARPVDAAVAVPGVRPHHDRLRQVLHLLHRAERPRPGAEPAIPSTSPPRSASSPPRAARRSRFWARPSTATSTSWATAGASVCPTCWRASTTRRASSASSSSPTSRAT